MGSNPTPGTILDMKIAFTNAQSSLEELVSQKPWKNLKMVELEQVHGNSVAVITDPSQIPSQKIPQVDGVLTNQPGVGLLVRAADCLPILLHHESGLIGAIHAGRKGTEKRILYQALRLARDKFAVTSDLKIWFGPAICKNCYQIDRQTDLHYDLIQENLQQLEEVFPPEAVSLKIAEICTLEHPDYYSYRQTGPGVKLNYFAITQ